MTRHHKIELLDFLHEEKNVKPSTWPFNVDNIEPWAFMQNVFTPAQCQTIITIGKNLNLEKAATGLNKNVNQNDLTRKSQTSWLSSANGNEWIFQQMTQVAQSLNQQFFNFDLWGFAEGLQFTEYQAPSDHYSWHTDNMYKGPIRKLSMSVQLSDPDDYEGGELVINNGTEMELPKAQGCAYAFPSYSLHGVKPVTKGVRYSLVAWITGPAFK
jgi:PKHD-type hydroxylase